MARETCVCCDRGGFFAASLSSVLVVSQDWLYEEGEDETKSTYVAKLNELRQIGQPLNSLYDLFAALRLHGFLDTGLHFQSCQCSVYLCS